MTPEPAIREGTISARSALTFVFGTLAAYSILLAVGLIRHEIWLDEAQAWLITCASKSLPDLHARLVWEPHPPLWYYLLYPLSRITVFPWGLQLTHWFVAVLSVAVFLRWAPFSRVQKVLFCFGYFPLFEYGVISRNYSLGILFFFIFCACYPRFRGRPHLAYIPLFLMVFAHLFASILALAVALGMVAEAWLADRTLGPEQEKKRGNTGRETVWLVVFVCVCGAVFFWMKPPVEMSLGAKTVLGFHPGRIVRVGCEIWRGMIPVPNLLRASFWGSNILPMGSVATRCVGTLASFFVLACALGTLKRKPYACLSFLSGTAAILLFSYVKGNTAIRHFGYIYILFVGAHWLSAHQHGNTSRFRQAMNRMATMPFGRRLEGAGERLWNLRHRLLTSLFAVHAFAGVFAVGMDVARPFSSCKQAAELIRQRGLTDLPILAEKDLWTCAVTAYLGRPIRYIRSDRDGTYLIWDQARVEPARMEDIVDKVHAALRRRGEALILMSYDLDEQELLRRGATFSLERLGAFPGCIHWQYLRVYKATAGTGQAVPE